MHEQRLVDVSGVIFSRVAPVYGEERSAYFGTDSTDPLKGGGVVSHARIAHQ